MEHFFLQVFGLDSYAWLVLLLAGVAVMQGLFIAFLVRNYLETKNRLHIVTSDSIAAYAKISESMNYIRTDLLNFTMLGTKSNDTIHKTIEHRLDRIDRQLEDLQRDILRK